MHKQPLLIMLLCFIAGILVVDQFYLGEKIVYGFLIFSVLLLFLIVIKNFWTQKLKNYFLGFFFFSTGVVVHFLHSQHPILPVFQGKQNVIFQVNKKLNSNEKNRRYEVSLLKIQNFKNTEKLPLNLVISVPKESQILDFKNYYQTEIYLNRVESPNNDFQFNYAKYLARKNVYFQSFASDNILSTPKKSISFPDKIRQKRLDVLQNIEKSTLQPKSKEFAKGIILADRTEMDAETVSDFSKSGLVHLLAISGTHMVIIFWLIMFLLKRVFPLKYRKLPIVLSLILIWGFAIFIDYGSSVMRSCIMISAYYGYILLQRKPDLLHALALAGFAILTVDSHQFFDVGFQLSFLAVLGIFWLNQPILNYFGKLTNRVKRFFASVVSVSLSAQIATLPLVIFYFHQYSLVSILANVVIIPFSEIIIIFSLLMTVFLGFNINIYWLNWLYDGMVNWLLKAIHWFANLDFFFAKNIPMTILEVVVLMMSIYFLRKILQKKELKSILRFTFLLLLFFALRTGLNFYHFQKKEVLVTNYFKQKILIVKQNGKAIFFKEANTKPEKIERFIIYPYVSSRRIFEFEVKTLPENSEKVFFQGKVYELNKFQEKNYP